MLTECVGDECEGANEWVSLWMRDEGDMAMTGEGVWVTDEERYG